MNYTQSKLIKWGIKLLTLGILAVVMCSVVNGQVEIERLKQAAQELQEKRNAHSKKIPKATNEERPGLIDF